MIRLGLLLSSLIALAAICPAYGGPPVTSQPAQRERGGDVDELRITVVGQRFAKRSLPYKTHGGREVSYLAREVDYRVLNTTEHDVFFVSTDPLPINLKGTRFSQSLFWPDDIRVHRSLVPVPTVTRIAPGEEKRFTFAYAQDGRLDVEFSYASKLDEKSLRTLVEIEGRVLDSDELDWFRGVARRHRIQVDAIEKKSSVSVRITPRSYVVY